MVRLQYSVLMNNTEQTWQNVDDVYRLYSKQKRLFRKNYRVFVKKGIDAGRRSELSGGGLLRSAGGWTVLKGLRQDAIRVEGNERILGDSDLVENVFKLAQEELEQKYDLRNKGYDFDRAAQRVAE